MPAGEPAAGRDVPALTLLFARAEGEPEVFGICEQLGAGCPDLSPAQHLEGGQGASPALMAAGEKASWQTQVWVGG